MAPHEEYFLKALRTQNVPIVAVTRSQVLEATQLEADRALVTENLRRVPDKLKASAYRVRTSCHGS